MTLWSAGMALLLDRLIGDPPWLPHPVGWMGKWIAFVERKLNRPPTAKAAQRVRGCLLTLSTVGWAGGASWGLLWLVHTVSPWLAVALNVTLVWTTIAWKGLVEAGHRVYQKLQAHGIEAARAEVGMIVGRDTQNLSEPEVVRATVETLAENIVDAIVAPVFFACIGGAPFALFYRAANTLDSMVGYKNERFRDFGWCSARLDDVLNYIPARLTLWLLWVGLWLLKMNPVRAYQTMRQDARKHPSPNSGIPESMVAGALGVQLGGTNFYGGQPSFRAVMGRSLRPLEGRDILRVERVVHVTVWGLWVLLLLGGAIGWLP